MRASTLTHTFQLHVMCNMHTIAQNIPYKASQCKQREHEALTIKYYFLTGCELGAVEYPIAKCVLLHQTKNTAIHVKLLNKTYKIQLRSRSGSSFRPGVLTLKMGVQPSPTYMQEK